MEYQEQKDEKENRFMSDLKEIFEASQIQSSDGKEDKIEINKGEQIEEKKISESKSLEMGKEDRKQSKDEQQNQKQSQSSFYDRLTQFFSSSGHALIIHSSKFALVSLFTASIFQIDLIHTGYFVFFMMFILFNYKLQKRLWILILVYSLICLTSLYLYQIISMLSEQKEYEVINTIGLIKTGEILIFAYKEHLFLLLTICIQYHVYETRKYHEIITQYYEEQDQQLLGNEKKNEDLENNSQNQQKSQKIDIFTMWFIEYGLWVCFIVLLIVGLLPPPNIFSLIYLIYVTVFVILTLIYNDEYISFEKISKFWVMLLIFAYGLLTLHYLYQIEFISDWLNNQSTHIKDFGFDKELITLKLVGNALVLSLVCAQWTVYNQPLFQDTSQELKKQNSKKLRKMKRHSLDYYIYSYKIYLKQICHEHISKILLSLVFGVSIYNKSLIGFLYLMFLLVILIIERDSRWAASWIPLTFYTFILVLTQYVFQLRLLEDFMSDVVKWTGFTTYDDKNETRTKEIITFMVLNILILAFCVLQRKSQKWSVYIWNSQQVKAFKIQFQEIQENFDELIKDFEKNSEIYIKVRRSSQWPEFSSQLQASREKSPNQQDENYMIEDKSNKEQSDFKYQQDKAIIDENFQQKDLKLSQKLFQDYLLKRPIYNGNKVLQKLQKFFHDLGFEISLLFIVTSAFYKQNIISIIYIGLAGYFSLFSKYLLLEDIYSHNKIRKLQSKWKFVYLFISVYIVLQYAVVLWFPSSWNIFYPWKDSDFFCNTQSKGSFSKNSSFHKESDLIKCLNYWKEWLSLEKIGHSELVFDFIAILCMLLYDMYFFVVKHKKKERKPQDSGDFTVNLNRKSLFKSITFLIYCYFYKVTLIFLFIIGAIDNLTGSSDLISGFYLIISIYLLYKSDLLLKNRNKIWKKVEIFNSIIMLGFIVFQAPIFPCPIVHEKDRFYFTTEECLYEQYSHKGFFLVRSSANNKSNAYILYILLCHTIGINKFSWEQFAYCGKCIFMILFFFLGLVQRKIWNHPYINAYINPYFKREEGNFVSRAIKYLEMVHLKRLWAHEYQKVQIEVFQSLQNRLDSKVKEWENLLAAKSQEEEQSKFLIEKEQEVINEEIQIKSEKQALSHQGPVLHLSDIREAYIKSDGDQKKAEQLIKHKLQDALEKAFKQIYLSTEIGIHIFYNKLLKRLEEDNKKLLYESQQSLENQKEDSQINSEQELSQKSREQQSKWKKLKKWMVRTNAQLKEFLSGYVFELYNYENGRFKNNIQEFSLLGVIGLIIMSNFEKICYFFFIINHVVNANMLSLFYPMSLFFYALLENPIPQKGYWKFIIYYTILIIFAKFLYQLPLFCGTPPFSIFHYEDDACENFNINPSDLVNRIDFFIGLRKYSGSSSYPRNQGFFVGIVMDYIVLISLFIQRYLLESLGFWRYVKIDKNQFLIPQFNQKALDQKEKILQIQNEQSDQGENIEDEDIDKVKASDGNQGQINQGQQSERKEEASSSLQHELRDEIIMDRHKKLEQSRVSIYEKIFTCITNFYFRMLPQYLPKTHEIKDVDSHEPKIVPTEKSLIKPGKDFYSKQFTITLLILIYFLLYYPKMIGKRETISEQLETNSQFSSDLVVVIVLVIFWIIIDRIIYKLRPPFQQFEQSQNQDLQESVDKLPSHSMLMKIFLYCFLVGFMHYYICFKLPNSSGVFFLDSGYLVFCYLLFCLYFYYSALQIKFGYPTNEGGQIFTESTDLFNRIAFKTYRAIPFLTEIKSILDWTVTRTSLDLFQWIKLDDAYSNLYTTKTDMDVRRQHKYGTKRDIFEKFSYGCCLVFLLILIIVGPIIMFSSFNPILEGNNVNTGQIELELVTISKNNSQSTTFNLFEVDNLDINSVTDDDFNTIKNSYNGIETTWKSKMQKVNLMPYSEKVWDISPPRLKQLKELLGNKAEQSFLTIKWKFRRAHPPGNEVASGSNTVFMNEKMKLTMLKLIDFKGKNQDLLNLEIPNLLPMFLMLGQSSKASQREFSSLGAGHPKVSSHINCILEFGMEDNQKFWKLTKNPYKNEIFKNDEKKASFILINEFVFGTFFGNTSLQISVIGLYATFVLAVGKFIRIFFDKISTRVIYEEMPNTEDLFDLCEGIFIARLEGDLNKEEELYDLLIRIYRSPEILLKLTGTTLNQKKN